MKMVYIVAVTTLFFFGILAATAVFYAGKSPETAADKSTEELAAELDRELGAAPYVDDADRTTGKEEKEQVKEREEQTPARDHQHEVSQDVIQETPSSDVILRGPEEGTVSIDELLQLVDE
ncbi:hypothetical protein SAMN05192534_10427 [Alteribacillus persepolensis]|uniref:Uncharacterized protein n=1 Tax=Alteribacillus persepolensis TaxID=568899 RepID=A0A1G8BFI3_9BACI|nr:hypothetical protein [Alteribacillus persepolensis]SDH31814.1 hypothetical protein SAMN05192534_10427 [Alteribacillus persepolensis]